MKRIRWIDETALILLHAETISQHGGAAEIRDAGLLDSALDRARNRATYEEDSTIPRLAAAYAYGIAMNHPFVDGNKRVALLALGLFLRLNGWKLTASQVDATKTILNLAAGKVTEKALAAWVEKNSERISRKKTQ